MRVDDSKNKPILGTPFLEEDFLVMYANVDSYMNKRDELFACIDKVKPVLLCFNEILPKTNNNYNVNEFSIPGYDFFVNENPKRGCIIHAHQSLNAEPCEELNKHEFEESVWCKFTSPNSEKILVGCVYRSPNSQEENKLKLFDLLRSDEIQSFDKVVICGDFNFSSVRWDGTWTNEADNEVIEVCRDAFLTQILENPTRFRTNQRPTMPDLVLINDDKLISEVTYLPPFGKSDHSTLLFDLNIKRITVEQVTKAKFDLKKGNYAKFREEMQQVDWKFLDGLEINDMWDNIKGKINKGMQEHIPKVSCKKEHRMKPAWMDKHCLRQIKRKYNAYKRYLNSSSGAAYQTYVRERNKAKKVIKEAKKHNERNIAKDAKSNPKKFWKYIQERLKWNTDIGPLKKANGDMALSEEEKAEELNSFFASVFTRERIDNIPDVEENTYSEGISLQEVRITPAAVEKKLGELNPSKAQGPDKVPARVLKELRKELSKPLTILFNKSLDEGRIPQEWKKAEVIAIFKKGCKNDPGNYRPVSLTCIVCKVLEALIRDVMVGYFKEYKLYSEAQHGFRQKRSCMTQLIEVIDYFTKMLDEHNDIDVVYLDFRKAFDSVPHRRLLQKLKGYGIGGSVLKWIEDFLSDREQQVRVGTAFSSSEAVISGIPQGSILGPILFTIFINDLPDSVQSNCKVFADDTKIYNTTDKSNTIQTDLISLQEWSNKWNLYFNVQKCKVLHIGKNNEEKDYTMTVNNSVIEIEKCLDEKDLGVYFDTTLSFDKHIQQAISKANQKMGMIRRTFKFMDRDMFITLYKAFVRPHLEYGNLIAYPYLKRQSSALEKVQRRATKSLTDCKDMTYGERLRFLRMPSLKARRLRGDLIEMFKIYHRIEDIDFDSLFTKATLDTTRQSEGKLYVQYARTNKRKFSFTIRVVKEWNILPNNIKLAKNTNEFKNLLDKDKNFVGRSYIYDE